MADRYKMLPSQVLEQASTLDLYIMNTANAWKNRQDAQIQAGANPAKHVTKEEMEHMLERVRKKDVS